MYEIRRHKYCGTQMGRWKFPKPEEDVARGNTGSEGEKCGVDAGETPRVEWLRGRGLVDGWVPGVKTLYHDRKVSDVE